MTERAELDRIDVSRPEAAERVRALERLRAVVEASRDAIIGKDLTGTITDWNAGAERMYGYSAAEAVGRPIEMLAPDPDDTSEFREIRERVKRGETVNHFETRRRRRDGSLIDVEIGVTPIRDTDGLVVGVSVVATDITVRRAAEEAQLRASALLEEAQRLARLGSWELFPGQERPNWWSDQVYEIFGVDRGVLASGDPTPLRALIHPADRPAYEAMLERVAQTGNADEIEFRILRPDGAVRTLFSRARRADEGDVVKLVGTVQDVTETRRLEREAVAARDRLAGVLDAATEMSIIGTDPTGRITVFNHGAELMLGYEADELIGRHTPEILHDPDEIAARAQELQIRPGFEVFIHAAHDRAETRDWTYVRKDGTRLTVSLTVTAVRGPDGEVSGFIGVARDVSEARAAERARSEAEHRFQAAFEHAPIGVSLTALSGSDRGRYLQTNDALNALVGRAPGELNGTLVDAITHPQDIDATVEAYGQLEAGETITLEKRLLHRDGREIWVMVSTTPVPAEHGAKPTYAVAQVVDISERKRFEGQLRHLVDHDALTGLFNRHRFETELERVIQEARRYDRCGALLILDLDGFKQVNDQFGHPVGDELVARVAALLRTSVRETDVVARLGGDEFAVILEEASESEAVDVADKIVDAIRNRGFVVRDARHARVTASVGITTFDASSLRTSEELIVEADVAMYDAKEAGRNRHSVYDRTVDRNDLVSKRDAWLERLREALEQELFVLHAQPIHNICGDGIPRFELLLRLSGEAGELILPRAFLYNAERFDLMGQIDRWVLRRGIELLHEHHAAGNDISLAVNLSGKTMNDLTLPEDIAAMLHEHPISPGRLVIEITETAAIVNMERARELARELRAMGCQFALDDFGAGFASFYYLKHLEFDYLKIDGEFIRQLTSTRSDQLVVGAVVEIARGLGTRTIAECVGDQATTEMLRRFGVDFGQGFHLGEPGPLAQRLPGLP